MKQLLARLPFFRSRMAETRQEWERNLLWFRLRYDDPAGATMAVNKLSRTKGVDRVAIYHTPTDGICRLYLGIPNDGEPILPHMAQDFKFSLTKEIPDLPEQPFRMIPAIALPTDRTYMAHVANEYLFVSLPGQTQSDAGTADPNEDARDNSAPEFSGKAEFFPTPPSKEPGRGGAVWHFPDPDVGNSIRPLWDQWPAPARLIASHNDPARWVLGRGHELKPLSIEGNINVYGSDAFASGWLTKAVSQALAANPGGIVVIDGHGELARSLKRKPLVTRLFNKNLLFVDMDGISARGFNPMNPLPSEEPANTVERWQAWFAGFGLRSDALDLLPEAFNNGIRSVTQLNKWLITKRASHFAQVEAFSVILEQILTAPELGVWLKQPDDYFADFPNGGSLIFTINVQNKWENKHMIRAILLAALNMPNLRLVLHAYPLWDKFDTGAFNGHRVMISNGPLLPGSTCILVTCQPDKVSTLSRRFLKSDPILAENLQLLRMGDGIVVSNGDITFTTWNKQKDKVKG